MEERGKTIKILDITIVTTLLILLFVLGLSIYNSDLYTNSFSEELKNAQMLFYSKGGQSIEKLSDLFQKAQTKEEKAAAANFLGSALLIYGDSSKRNQGIKLLKETSLNEQYPSFYRAGAANALLDFYLFSNRIDAKEFGKQLFSGPIWGDFSEGSNYDAAALQGYRWSKSIFPTFQASYNSALIYSLRLQNTEIPTATRREYVDSILKNLQEGNDAFREALIVGRVPKDEEGKAYLIRGNIFEQLYYTDDELKQHTSLSVSRDDVIELYQTALSIFNTVPDNKLAQLQKLYTQYYLLGFESQFESSEINTEVLVNSISSTSNTGFLSFIKSNTVENQHPSLQEIHRKRIRSIIEKHPSFTDFLIDIGWDAEELSTIRATQ